MLYNLYSIYDSVSEEYGPIFHAKNEAVARRAVESLLHDGVKSIDFDLYCLGTFDNDTGVIKPSCYCLCNCSDIVDDSLEVKE